MNIYKSHVWNQPKIIPTILRNIPVLDPLVMLYNSKLFYIKENEEIISFVTIKENFGFIELGTVFTYPKFRKNDHMRKLLHQVLDKYPNIVVLCRRKSCTFYSKFGFKEKSDCGWWVSLRKGISNTFLGSEVISMKRNS